MTDRIQRLIQADPDEDIEVYEICPVCMEPWGDINHTVAWKRDLSVKDAIGYELVCSRHGLTGGEVMIDPTNDEVQVYEDADGMWRWRRVDDGNGRIVSISAEGYTSGSYCMEAAKAYNSDVESVKAVQP